MTGVKLAKAFGVLLMVVIVCSKQIPEEQHSTYPATDEAHFTNNAYEYHDEDLKVNVGKRMIDHKVYEGGTKDVGGVVWEVLFHLNPKANIARRENLQNRKKEDLDEFMDSLTVDNVFSRISKNKKSGLAISPNRHFRLDMQGKVKCCQLGGQDCYNLQVQLNNDKKKKAQRKKGKKGKKLLSTTYAIVLVPLSIDAFTYLTDEVVRKAFFESSTRPAAVTLEIKKKVVQEKKKTKGKKQNWG
jgi:hypothetical protein